LTTLFSIPGEEEMNKESIIILGENDDRHADLVSLNLRNSGISNEMLFFHDGEDILRYLFINGNGFYRTKDTSYILILDTELQDMYGIEVLKKLNQING
jgi:DNA-binding response OmpR family regulator